MRACTTYSYLVGRGMCIYLPLKFLCLDVGGDPGALVATEAPAKLLAVDAPYVSIANVPALVDCFLFVVRKICFAKYIRRFSAVARPLVFRFYRRVCPRNRSCLVLRGILLCFSCCA